MASSLSTGGHVFVEEAMENLHWKLKEDADGDHRHEVTFAVRQKNVDQLETLLYDVSDPVSKNYGKHWGRDKLADLTSNPESTQAIIKYLEENHATITFVSKYGEYISAEASVRTWEKVFNTKFFMFVRDSSTLKANSNTKVSKKAITRAKDYSLPHGLVDHVTTVFELVHLPIPSRIKATVHQFENAAKDTHNLKASLRTQAGPGFVSPSLINSQYGIQSNAGLSSASQGIYGALDQYLSPTDLSIFQQNFNLPKKGVTYSYGDHVADGQCGTNSQNCMEANLDVQYIMAVAWNVPTTYYYWDDSQDFMVGWMKSVSSMDNLSQIYSISYGADETAIPTSYASQFNVEAAKLGILGVTLIVASGDDGAQSSKASGQPSKCGYVPSFPATSPFVTAVGATMGPESGSSEVACQAGGEVAITTGGGFSVRYTRPSYQNNAVRGYFAKVAGTGLNPVSGYNANGRGLPDVSVMGHNYFIVVDKKNVFVDGTSASAPVFAGMVALLNSYRLANSSSPMGWINPALYATNGSFAKDITSGNNKCTSIYGGNYGSYQTTCCSQGFTATSGWDPVTGFGSIDFHEFVREYADVTPYPIAPLPAVGSSTGGLQLWSSKVVVGIIAITIIIAGILFYGLTLLINRYCFKKSATTTSHRYNEPGAVIIATPVPASRSFFGQPASSSPTYAQRQNMQIDYGDYFTDVRPTVVTVHTRL